MSVFRISERQTDMCFSYSYRKLKTLFEKRKKTNHNGMCEEILSVNTRAMEENKAGYSEFVVRTGLHHCFPEICLSNPFFVFVVVLDSSSLNSHASKAVQARKVI